jgi:hypothetical protein
MLPSLRTSATTVLAASAAPLLLLASSAVAAPTETLHAGVTSSGPQGERISLAHGGRSAGTLAISGCANTSPTAFVCKGTGTVLGLGPAAVRIRWRCPVDRPCQDHAEGALKNNGSLLLLLHVEATVAEFQQKGASFTVRAEQIGE